jgi:hypothetical protein
MSHHHNPYRSELSGLYAAITGINALVDYFHISKGSITLACNNLGAITITEYPPDGVNPSSCAQFDLVMAIQRLKSTNISWTHVHVDGHQDLKKQEPLTPIELINVEMDTKAKLHWTSTHTIQEADRLLHFDAEPWSVHIGNTKLVKALSSSLSEWCQRPRIQSYWIKKSRFSANDLPWIDTKIAVAAL